MIPGMAYFVRRLLENTSNQSWLRAGFSDEVLGRRAAGVAARARRRLSRAEGQGEGERRAESRRARRSPLAANPQSLIR